MNDDTYEFTNQWFDFSSPVWENIVPRYQPRRILEVGSYEGASACFLIDLLTKDAHIEIDCVDTWGGGIEHMEQSINMSEVERRFIKNTKIAIKNAKNPVNMRMLKGFSCVELAKIIASGKSGYYDFVYIDGSHQAPDVLIDAVLGFSLLRVGGIIVFDDYLWSENLPSGVDPIRCPKPAIDAFTNIFCRKAKIVRAPLYQLYVEKTSD